MYVTMSPSPTFSFDVFTSQTVGHMLGTDTTHSDSQLGDIAATQGSTTSASF